MHYHGCMWASCQEKFSTKMNLLNHLKRDHITYCTSFRCEWHQCHCVLNSIDALVAHIHSHHIYNVRPRRAKKQSQLDMIYRYPRLPQFERALSKLSVQLAITISKVNSQRK